MEVEQDYMVMSRRYGGQESWLHDGVIERRHKRE